MCEAVIHGDFHWKFRRAPVTCYSSTCACTTSLKHAQHVATADAVRVPLFLYSQEYLFRPRFELLRPAFGHFERIWCARSYRNHACAPAHAARARDPPRPIPSATPIPHPHAHVLSMRARAQVMPSPSPPLRASFAGIAWRQPARSARAAGTDLAGREREGRSGCVVSWWSPAVPVRAAYS